jgi:hypothetical protein
MAQQYGAAQPIADFFRVGKKEKKAPETKVDTSWHDQMTKRASDSFTKSSSKKEPMLGKTETKKKAKRKLSAKRK